MASVLDKRSFATKTWGHLIFLIVVSLVFYARSFDNYWIKDDLAIGNFFVGQDMSWGTWLKELWPSYMESEHYWRPIPLLPGFFEHKLWGLNPVGYHIDNTLMHAFTACLIYFVTNRLTENASKSIGFCGALVFAINPVNAESVVWVMQRMVVICLFFSLAAILLWLKAVQDRKPLLRIVALMCLTLALLSKEIALTLPGIFFLIDWLYGKNKKLAFLWAIPSALLLATYFLCRYLMWGQIVNTYAGLSPMEYAKANQVFENFHLTLAHGLVPVNRGVFGKAGSTVLTGIITVTYFIAALRALVLLKTSRVWRRVFVIGLSIFILGVGPILPICWIDERLFNARFFYQPAFGFQLIVITSLLLPFRSASVPSHIDTIVSRIALFFLVTAFSISLSGGLTAFDHGGQQVQGLQEALLNYSDRLEQRGERRKTIVVLYTPTQYQGVPTLEYSLELALRPPLAPRTVGCIPLLSRDFLTPKKWAQELRAAMKQKQLSFSDLRWVECRSEPLGIRPYFGAREPALGRAPAQLLEPPNYSFLENDGEEPSFQFKAHKDAITFRIRFAVRGIDYVWGPYLKLKPTQNFDRDDQNIVTFKPSFKDPSQPQLPDLWQKMMRRPLRHPVPLTWRVASFDAKDNLIGVSEDFRLVILNALD